jgi:hypothetical protein
MNNQVVVLTLFLALLGSNAALADAYKKDPVGVMKANGVSDAEITAVMAGDLETLKSLNGDEGYQSFLLINHGNDH